MAMTDLQRALAYGESELGEVAILNEAASTYAIKRARDGATVLAPGNVACDRQDRVAAIHPATVKTVT